MADERRLGICIKGGVSLGAYEAGVLAKTLELIANNNSQSNAIPWYVDALAGASAGSMTAVATACSLLNSGPNYLWNMWVTQADITALAPQSMTGVDDGYKNGHNLLNANALDVLAGPFNSPPALKPHGALRPGAALLRMIFSLSNIDGVPQPFDTLNPTPLAFRQYADSARYDLSLDQNQLSVSAPDSYAYLWNQSNSKSAAWQAMVQAAIGSGSFPLAFAPRALWRSDAAGNQSARYYSDGGFFDNDPVGKLIDLVHEIDWDPANASYRDNQRRYLIVHTAPTDLSNVTQPGPYNTMDLNPIALAGKLVPAVLNESMESGLLGIAAVNKRFQQRLVVFNRFAKIAQSAAGTTAALAAATSALASLRGFSDAQLQAFRGFMIPDLQDTDPTLHDYLVKLPDAAQTAFIDFAILFDLSFGMLDKVTVNPIVVAPAADETLSGSPLFAFAGFFSQRLREFDFARGQYDAFMAWQAISNRPEKDFTIADAAHPSPVGQQQADVGAPSSSTEYKNGLATFHDRIKKVIDSAIDELKNESGPVAAIGLDILKIIANLGVGSIS